MTSLAIRGSLLATLLLASFGVALLRAEAPGAAVVRIVLRSETRVAPGLVRLGDVAEVHGDDAGRAAALREVELFPAPAEDLPRDVARRVVQDVVSLRLGPLAGVEYRGAESVRIVTTEAATTTAMTPPRELPTGFPRRAPIVHPRHTSAYAEPAPIHPAVAARPLPLSDLASIPRPASPSPARPSLESIDVVVAARALAAGQTITAADVQIGAVARAAVRHDTSARVVEEVVGKATTRPIAAGQPIDLAAVRTPVLVKRNDIVRVIARGAGVQVKTSGRALGDGSYGDLVEVQMLDSRERFVARAIDPQTVEIATASAVWSAEIAREGTTTQ